MKRFGQLITAGTALTLVGTLAGCGSGKMSTSPQTTLKYAANQTVTDAAFSSHLSWNQIVVSSMNAVSMKTSVPLVAPTYVGQPLNSNYPNLTSTTTSSNDAYNVTFHLTSTKLRVNSPAINQPPNTGLAQYVGAFGAKKFHISKNALQALDQFVLPVSPKATQTSVNLGSGMVGEMFRINNTETVEWHEGNWKCQVEGDFKSSVLSESQTIVSYLHTQLLPETTGTLLVQEAVDGNHTELHWVIGNVMFSASDYHHAMNAIKVAMSMRMYPSGRSTGVQR